MQKKCTYTEKDVLGANLTWLLQAGVDEVMEQDSVNRFDVSHKALPEVKDFSPATRLSKQKDNKVSSGNTIPLNSNSSAGNVEGFAKTHGADHNPLPHKTLGTIDAIECATHMVKNIDTMSDLTQCVSTFSHCPSLSKTASNTVLYKGARNPVILGIGLAPTKEDDKIGVPFSGKRSLLLARMFGAIGYNINTQIGLTNAVFWYPPGARSLTLSEVAICQPFLNKIITITQPKVLLLFGGDVCTHLLNTTQGIHKIRKVVHTYENQTCTKECIAIYSPEYILKSPICKKHVWEDLKNVKHHLDTKG